MLTTTGYNFEGYVIKEYLDVISTSVVLGTGIFSSFSASMADLTGTKSGMYEDKLEAGRRKALAELKQRAQMLGGNAIIGIDIDYTTFGSDVLGVIANGTAVKVKRDDILNSDTVSIPVLSYNTQLPFNICSIRFDAYNTGDALLALLLRSYSDKAKINALITDIELKNIFGDSIVLENMIFAVNQNAIDSFYSTEFVKIDVKNLRVDLLQKAYVSVKKIIFYGSSDVIDVDVANEHENTQTTSLDIQVLRKNYGEDVVCDKQINDGTWTCFCGAENNENVDECYRCHRKFGGKYGSINRSVLSDKNIISGIIDEVMTKGTANDIYEYISSLGIKELESLEYELKVLQKQEKIFGENKKDEAMDIIIKMIYQKS